MDVKNVESLRFVKVSDEVHNKIKGFWACGTNYIPKEDLDFFINYLIEEYGENIVFSYKTRTPEDADNVEQIFKSFMNLSTSKKVEFLKRIEPIKSKLEI